MPLEAESPCLHSSEVRDSAEKCSGEEKRGATARWMEPPGVLEISALTLPIQTHNPCFPGGTPATRAVGLAQPLSLICEPLSVSHCLTISATVLCLEPEPLSVLVTYCWSWFTYVLNNFSHFYREFSLRGFQFPSLSSGFC